MKRKTVLITGASRGIGKAAALLFAQNGYDLFINCRQSAEDLKHVKEEIDAAGMGICEMLIGDVGNPDDVRKMFNRIHAKREGIDVLVNNAGVAHIGLLSEMSDEEWNQILQTNLSSAFYCSRAAIPYMISKKSGKIIQVSSVWGRVGASCEVAYSAAKSGIHGFTKALAKELAPSNIQVNAVACGVIDTIMNSQLNEEERAALEYEIPAGRFGTPEEAAMLIYDIAAGHDYMTGQILTLDGGFI